MRRFRSDCSPYRRSIGTKMAGASLGSKCAIGSRLAMRARMCPGGLRLRQSRCFTRPMTPMPARIVLQPDVWDVLLQQVPDENAALHAENGRLRAENERLRDEGNAKDAEIERQRAEIAALQARLGRPKKTPRNSSVPQSQGAKRTAAATPPAANPPAAPARPRRGHP